MITTHEIIKSKRKRNRKRQQQQQSQFTTFTTDQIDIVFEDLSDTSQLILTLKANSVLATALKSCRKVYIDLELELSSVLADLLITECMDKDKNDLQFEVHSSTKSPTQIEQARSIVKSYEIVRLSRIEFDFTDYSSYLPEIKKFVLNKYNEKIEKEGASFLSNFSLEFKSTKCVMCGYTDHVKSFQREVSSLNFAETLLCEEIVFNKNNNADEFEILKQFKSKRWELFIDQLKGRLGRGIIRSEKFDNEFRLVYGNANKNKSIIAEFMKNNLLTTKFIQRSVPIRKDCDLAKLANFLFNNLNVGLAGVNIDVMSMRIDLIGTSSDVGKLHDWMMKSKSETMKRKKSEKASLVQRSVEVEKPPLLPLMSIPSTKKEDEAVSIFDYKNFEEVTETPTQEPSSFESIDIAETSLTYLALCTIKGFFLLLKKQLKVKFHSFLIEVSSDKTNRKFQVLNLEWHKNEAQWRGDVTRHLQDLETQQLKKIELDCHAAILSEYLSNKEQITMKFFNLVDYHVTRDGDKLVLYGYKKQVNELGLQIAEANVEKTNKEEIKVAKKRQLNYQKFNFDNRSHQFEWKILSEFEGKFFNELSELLDNEYGRDFVYLELRREQNCISVCHSSHIEQDKVKNFIREHFFKQFSASKLKQLIQEQLTGKRADCDPVKLANDENRSRLAMFKNKININKYNAVLACSTTKTNASSPDNSETVSKKLKINESSEFCAKITGLKWYQIALMQQIKLIESLQQMFASCQIELCVKFSELVIVSASQEEIAKVKAEAMSMLRKIVAAEIDCENRQTVVSDYRRNVELYSSLLSKAGIICVIDVDTMPESMLIYSMSHEQILQCQYVILNIAKDREIKRTTKLSKTVN